MNLFSDIGKYILSIWEFEREKVLETELYNIFRVKIPIAKRVNYLLIVTRRDVSEKGKGNEFIFLDVSHKPNIEIDKVNEWYKIYFEFPMFKFLHTYAYIHVNKPFVYTYAHIFEKESIPFEIGLNRCFFNIIYTEKLDKYGEVYTCENAKSRKVSDIVCNKTVNVKFLPIAIYVPPVNHVFTFASKYRVDVKKGENIETTCNFICTCQNKEAHVGECFIIGGKTPLDIHVYLMFYYNPLIKSSNTPCKIHWLEWPQPTLKLKEGKIMIKLSKRE